MREIRFVAEHRDEVIVFREVRKDPLQYENVLLTATGWTRQKDLGHPASRELRDQLITTEIPGVARDQSPRRNGHGDYYA